MGCLLFNSCTKKEEDNPLVQLFTYTPYFVTADAALCGGEIASALNLRVNDFGLCWSESRQPTVNDNTFSALNDYNYYLLFKWFTHEIEDLKPNTTYYVRTYAVCGDGQTYYGEQKSFFTSTSEKDAYYRTFNVNGVSFRMVRVENGTFQMGAQNTDAEAVNFDSDARYLESPVHEVKLTNTYYIGETEVTQALWTAVMGNNPSYHKDDDQLPVERVSWNDIVNDFLPQLNTLTGMNFRLPTEAEWEFAAKGVNQGRHFKFAGSDDAGQVAWSEENSDDRTHPVGQLAPNERGLYDMSGNVWEWCNDWFDYYTQLAQINPIGNCNQEHPYRMNRGGSEGSGIPGCRCTERNGSYPNKAFIDLGFRLACDPK